MTDTPTLADRITTLRAASPVPEPDDVLEAFLAWTTDIGLELYDHQEEAILEVFAGRHVVLDTPTGSGKSMVALALHVRELALHQRSVYTAPIKALVTEKFLSLCESLGAEHVGLMTGDATVNRDAPVLCCTAEVLAKMALRHGELLPCDAVVMDEFHYYGDRDRGMAWQLPLITLPQTRFLLMSATLGDTSEIRADLTERTGHEAAWVRSKDRPVPLTYEYNQDRTLLDRLESLVRTGKAPVYVVHFQQRAATDLAQSLMSTNLCTADEKKALKAAMKGVRFDSPFGPKLRRFLLHGVAVHHAGLLPKYRLLVERMAQQGLFKIICGTDTLGVGINVPIRTVLFSQLCKFDGTSVDILTVRDFRQIGGRAGRRGFDDEGLVVAQAPEWAIANRKLDNDDSIPEKKKRKKRQSAPTRGYKHWDAGTFERLTTAPAEALEARFAVDHGLVLQLLQKSMETLGDPMFELDALVDASRLSKREKEEAKAAAREQLASLVAHNVVVDHGEDMEPQYTVQADLQDDFSIHHALSLFLVHAIGLLEPTHPNHALNVLTLVETILEHPKVILRAQVRREKGRKVAELKAEGMDYEDRMAVLEEVTWPKPHAEWIYATYEAYREDRPWLQDDHARPKSIAREMVETAAAFGPWVKELNLEGAEGVVLRYLSQVYKTLLQNVPVERMTDDLEDVLAFLRALLARVDDSLVRTWQAMVDGELPEALAEDVKPVDLTEDPKALKARVRAELHALAYALVAGDYDEAAAGMRHTEDAWQPSQFQAAVAAYVEEHGPLRFDARSRQGWTTQVDIQEKHVWVVRQLLPVPLGERHAFEEDDDLGDVWAIEAVVDLRGDTNPEGPLLQVRSIGP